MSKHPEQFGKGSPEAVAASEGGNNGVTGGAMIPMLTLGVPGDAVAAIMIGALTIQGLTPGPMLFKTNKVLVYTIFLGMFVANTIMVLLGFSCIRLFTKVLSVPKTILTPVIFILCVVGSYAMRSNFYDVGTMLIAGVIGWLMGKVKIPTSPAILGLILGPMAEKNFRTALLKSSGNPVVFFNTPICWFFLGPDRVHPLWRGPRTVKEKSGIAVKKKYIKIQGTLTGFGINFQRSGCLFLVKNLQKL